MATMENEYYLRSTLLIIKGGVFATRKILTREVRRNGGDIDILLLSHKRKLGHEFHKKQYEKLFPICGETNIDVWDIAMLTGVLLIVFNPTLSDEDRNAIRTIKSNRNEVSAHNPTAALSIDTFEYCRDELEKSITHLCSTFDDTIKKECKDIINDCLSGTLEIRSCLENTKKFGDTDDLFRAIMDKFDTTGKRLSDEITSAKRVICTAVHDGQEKQTSEIRNMVIEAVRKAYHEGRIMKTVKVFGGDSVVDSEITVGGSTEKWIDLCEKIIVDITNKAVRKTGGSTEFVDIEKAVLDLLDEINGHDDVEVQGATKGSILLRIGCSTYKGFLDALLYIKGPRIQQKLDGIAVSLQSHFCLEQPLKISIQVSEDQLKSFWNELRTDYETKQKTFRLPIRCCSFGGLEHVWNLFEGCGSENLEKLANTLSTHLGTTITLTSAVNVEMYLKAIEEEGLVEIAGTRRHVLANEIRQFLHTIDPVILVFLLHKHEILPQIAYNCIINIVETGDQKEQILDDLTGILIHRLQHPFNRVSRRRLWKLFVLSFMKIYMHYTQIPGNVPKIDVKKSKENGDALLQYRLYNLDSGNYRYLLKTAVSTPVITIDDVDKKFLYIALLLDYGGFAFSMDEKDEKLFESMYELVNKTTNPLVSDIMYLNRKAVDVYRGGMMTQTETYLFGAMCKACFVNPCYELIDMHYTHVFLNLMQYEQLPAKDIRKALLRSGRIGLEMLTCTKEYPVYNLWRYMFKLRMALCLLGLGSNGNIIRSNEIAIDDASLLEAEYLLQDIARMQSVDYLFEEREYLYYFALVRLLTLKRNCKLAKLHIEVLLNELKYSSVKKDQYISVAKSYLKEIQDALKSNGKSLENKDDIQENSTKEHPGSTSQTTDQSPVYHKEEQESQIAESKRQQQEIQETPIDLMSSNPEKVLSDLRQMFGCFINERIVQDPQTKTSRKKTRKAKRRRKDMSEYIDEPGLE